MNLTGPKIPVKARSAYEAYTRRVERQVAIVAAWVLLLTIIFYQFSHELRFGHQPELWWGEFGLRLPVFISAIFTLISYYSRKPACQSRYLLRIMGLSVMATILSLFLLHYDGQQLGSYQISNGLVISFFGVTVLAVRGLREWWLLFLVPLVLFCIVSWILGHRLTDLLTILIDPLVMMVIGIIMSEALRQLRANEFLAREQLSEQASTDQLTGLLNRRAMHEIMLREHIRSQRSGQPFGLILGDLDRFKLVNDTFGHNTGDTVLQETARRMSSHMRAQDALCRWGGEELLVMLPETNLEGTLLVAEKIRCSFSDTPILADGHVIEQTISLGVSECYGYDEVEAAIKWADDALYLAKKNGRNRVEAVTSPHSDTSEHLSGHFKPGQTAET